MPERKTEQSARTRQLLIDAAEKLIALHGVPAVSSRQISKSAGQGNNYAVGHHFGSKDDLLRAVLIQHNRGIDELRSEYLDALGTNPTVRDWLRCLVCPEIDYIRQLGSPTYFARFTAQVSSDPASTVLLYERMAASQPLLRILDGFYAALPEIPDDVLEVRNNMTRHMIVQSLADLERATETGGHLLSQGARHCDVVVDAITGMWLAPVSTE